MEYDNMPSSSNIEDRRGQRGGAVGAGGLGIGAIVVIFAISYFTGISPQVLMSGAEMMGVGQQSAPPDKRASRPERPDARFSLQGRRQHGGSLGGSAAGAGARAIPACAAGHL